MGPSFCHWRGEIQLVHIRHIVQVRTSGPDVICWLIATGVGILFIISRCRSCFWDDVQSRPCLEPREQQTTKPSWIEDIAYSSTISKYSHVISLAASIRALHTYMFLSLHYCVVTQDVFVFVWSVFWESLTCSPNMWCYCLSRTSRPAHWPSHASHSPPFIHQQESGDKLQRVIGVIRSYQYNRVAETVDQ
jgi:hypothetical protein